MVASRNPSLITCELSDASSVELVYHPVALRTALIWSLVLVYSGLVAFLVTQIVNSTRQNRKVWARFLIRNRIWRSNLNNRFSDPIFLFKKLKSKWNLISEIQWKVKFHAQSVFFWAHEFINSCACVKNQFFS